MQVKDRLWLWCHPAGSHNGIYGVPRDSRITPVEACCYLGITNAIMVRYHDYGPFPPYDQFALPFRALDNVVWFVVGASGQTEAGARGAAIDLARRVPNISGVMMDDFFRGRAADGSLETALSVDEMKEMRGQLRLSDRTLDLWIVLYSHEMDDRVQDYLALSDVVTFWTWRSEHLNDLDGSFACFERIAAKQRKVLGCYLWDYANKQPMPLELMKKQCEFGLNMLKAGRIEGMIFLASCVCDLELETVEWLRAWIAEVGEQPVG